MNLSRARAEMGSALLKFFKIGRLAFGPSGSDPIRDAFNPKRGDYRESYETNVWAYRGISAIATAAGRIPFKVVEKTAAGHLQDVSSHPLIPLLENPNPFMTRQDIVELLFIFAESCGDAYWLLDDGADGPRAPGAIMKLSQVDEIWPVPSNEIKPIADPKDFIAGFEYKPGTAGKAVRFSTEEILRISYPSPMSMLTGLASLRSTATDLAADAYAAAFERFIMKNLAANIMFLKTESSFTNDQRDEYRRALASVFKGTRVAFMENGLDFATPQLAAKDLPFLELDARRQRRVLGALGVPPIMAGSEDAKYDNAEQQKRFFWGDTMRPKLSRLCGMLTKKIHAMGESDRLVVIPDMAEIQELQPDAKVRAETGKTWREMGVPLNEVIKHFGTPGMDEVEGGDISLVPSSLIPLADAIDPTAGEGELGPGPNDPANPKPTVPQDPNADPAADPAVDPGTKGLSDKALDDAHWKRFIATTEGGSRQMRGLMKRFFRGQKKATLGRLLDLYRSIGYETRFSGALIRDPRVSLVLIDVDAEAKKLGKKAEPVLRHIYKKFGEQAIEDVGAGIDFSITTPAAVEFLTDHVAKFAFEVNRATRSQLNDLLAAKFNEGATQKELTTAVQDLFGGFERYRAARIARTESGIAGNSGIFDGMVQAGVTEKRWISSRDAKVRDTHEVADGQQTLIDEPFDVGGALLMYPGDPTGPADEVINCRCVSRAGRTRS